MRRLLSTAVLGLASALAWSGAQAAVVVYNDLASYNAAVGAHTIVDFTGLAEGTSLSNQYAGVGITFTDGNDTTELDPVFVVDGAGYIDGGASTILLSFDQTHFGVEFPGALQIDLYDGLALVGSQQFGLAGTGFFGGLVSDVAFDRVVLSDWFGPPGFYDNLHFGTAQVVPEPSSLPLVLLGALGLLGARKRLDQRVSYAPRP